MSTPTKDVDRLAWSLVRAATPHLACVEGALTPAFASRLYVQIRKQLRSGGAGPDTATVDALSLVAFATLLSDDHHPDPSLMASLRLTWQRCLMKEIAGEVEVPDHNSEGDFEPSQPGGTDTEDGQDGDV